MDSPAIWGIECQSRRTMTFKEESDMQSTLVAVDLAKNVFEIAISHQPGKVAERHRVSRSAVPFFAERQPEVVLLEATGSAHHWGRKLQQLVHQPVLLPPRAVKRYRDGNKTDRTDAKAMLEASRNEAIRPVPLKTVAQQALTSLHRLRSAWMATRTARINTVRGLLRELGLPSPRAGQGGARSHRPARRPRKRRSSSLQSVLLDACEEIAELERGSRVRSHNLRHSARKPPAVGHLRSIPGVGLLTATAFPAFVGDARRSRCSTFRQLPRSDSPGALQRRRPR